MKKNQFLEMIENKNSLNSVEWKQQWNASVFEQKEGLPLLWQDPHLKP